MHSAIGVDVGGTRTRVALVNSEGVILKKLVEHTDKTTLKCVAKQIARLAGALLREARIGASDILGVGIGIPAVVDSTNRTIV